MTTVVDGLRCDVYPVGLWLDVRTHGVVMGAAKTLRYVRYQARARNWRAIRNTFNGFLCEPSPFPANLTRCGKGWTRRSAIRSLERHIARSA